MTFARRLVRLYPKAWRARYEEEFLALLEARPATLAVTVNILCGIADAHLRRKAAASNQTALERMAYMMEKLQKTCLKGLIVFALFVLPCIFFSAMLDDSPLLAAMRSARAFGFSFFIFNMGCLIAGLAILAGGAVILYGVFRWAASQKRRDIQALLFIPAAAFVVFSAAFFYMNLTYQDTLAGWLRGSFNQCIAMLFLLVSAACVYAALRKARASSGKYTFFGSEIDSYRLGMLAAIPAAAGMAVATVSAIVWGFMANAYAPDILLSGNLGIFQAGTLAMFVGIVLVMLVTTAVSGVMAIRGVKYLKA